MFDFERLEVYHKAIRIHIEIRNLLSGNHNIDRESKDQLFRSSLSIILNIAEGSGRLSKLDRRRFYIISRGSVYESIAIFQILMLSGLLSKELYETYYGKIEEISKMLTGLINSCESSTQKKHP